MNEWINVKDRVPENTHRNYLVYCIISGFNPGFEVAEWDASQQEWYTWSDVADVLFWMPIPELPALAYN